MKWKQKNLKYIYIHIPRWPCTNHSRHRRSRPWHQFPQNVQGRRRVEVIAQRAVHVLLSIAQALARRHQYASLLYVRSCWRRIFNNIIFDSTWYDATFFQKIDEAAAQVARFDDPSRGEVNARAVLVLQAEHPKVIRAAHDTVLVKKVTHRDEIFLSK
mgnify:CR=1 FL=1